MMSATNGKEESIFPFCSDQVKESTEPTEKPGGEEKLC